MDLLTFIIERRERIEAVARIKDARSRLHHLDVLEKWIESVRQPGWVIGRRLVAIERLRARKELR